MSGPTSVPCRVMTPSIAASRQLIRRITLSSSRAMSAACSSQSAWEAMKNVVWPESPYGVCTTRSSPTPPVAASARSSS